jgi:hypothetical protein
LLLALTPSLSLKRERVLTPGSQPGGKRVRADGRSNGAKTFVPAHYSISFMIGGASFGSRPKSLSAASYHFCVWPLW